MIGNITPDICCGCESCAQICPVNCIKMTENREGFLYPQVNAKRCIGCGKCERVCPVSSPEDDSGFSGQVYAAYAKDELRLESASGGLFALIAGRMIREGGTVCGARLSEDCLEVFHVVVENESDLAALRGSKYVQSRMGNVYRETEALLKEGRQVLFSGTPCQVEGLLRFLGKPYDGLITVDLICHGVPSPKAWRQYAEEIWGEKGLSGYSFRDKSRGWITHLAAAYLAGGEKRLIPWEDDPFCTGFSDDIFLRRCCYDCRFRRAHHSSDITLGDFWGIEAEVPELFDDKGISAVMINSPQGRKIFEDIKGELVYRQVSFEAMARHNAVIRQPDMPKNREAFFRDIDRLTFRENMRKNGVKGGFAVRLKRVVKRVIGQENTKRLKKLLGKK